MTKINSIDDYSETYIYVYKRIKFIYATSLFIFNYKGNNNYSLFLTTCIIFIIQFYSLMNDNKNI